MHSADGSVLASSDRSKILDHFLGVEVPVSILGRSVCTASSGEPTNVNIVSELTNHILPSWTAWKQSSSPPSSLVVIIHNVSMILVSIVKLSTITTVVTVLGRQPAAPPCCFGIVQAVYPTAGLSRIRTHAGFRRVSSMNMGAGILGDNGFPVFRSCFAAFLSSNTLVICRAALGYLRTQLTDCYCCPCQKRLSVPATLYNFNYSFVRVLGLRC